MSTTKLKSGLDILVFGLFDKPPKSKSIKFTNFLIINVLDLDVELST